jgi:cation/acetate symporter
MAISGDYMSAASFLGISGAIALSGYDGFLYSIGFLVAWLVALLLVAELLRNSGRFTLADQLAYRMRQRPVRTAAAVSTLGVSIFYLLAQMVGAGSLVALLLGVTSDVAKNLTIVLVGALMIFYVTVGGMKGTTWVQIVKAILLMGGTILVTVIVLAKFGFNLSELLGTAAENSGKGEAFLQPGLKYGVSLTSKIDFVSLGLALVLGTAGLPHILIRFYTVPTSRAARTSVIWAIGIIGSFYLMTLVLGFGGAALLDTGPESQVAATAGNVTAPLLAQAAGGGADSTGGAVLLALIAAVAFATILAVVAGLTISASTSFAHDFYTNVIHRGAERSPGEEVRVARITAFVVGAVAIAIAIPVAVALAVRGAADDPDPQPAEQPDLQRHDQRAGCGDQRQQRELPGERERRRADELRREQRPVAREPGHDDARERLLQRHGDRTGPERVDRRGSRLVYPGEELASALSPRGVLRENGHLWTVDAVPRLH